MTCQSRMYIACARSEVALRCLAVDSVAGALQEGDTAFDFLGPVQADSIMQQVAEGKSCRIPTVGDARLVAHVAFISQIVQHQLKLVVLSSCLSRPQWEALCTCIRQTICSWVHPFRTPPPPLPHPFAQGKAHLLLVPLNDWRKLVLMWPLLLKVAACHSPCHQKLLGALRAAHFLQLRALSCRLA